MSYRQRKCPISQQLCSIPFRKNAGSELHAMTLQRLVAERDFRKRQRQESTHGVFTAPKCDSTDEIRNRLPRCGYCHTAAHTRAIAEPMNSVHRMLFQAIEGRRSVIMLLTATLDALLPTIRSKMCTPDSSAVMTVR